MPDSRKRAEQVAYTASLKMLAVQLAGEFPANRRDAHFLLRRIKKILDENVYDGEMRVSDVGDNVVPITSVAHGDRAS